ncbi:MAG: hypothetical protein AAFQ98_05015 [Bacteroidota bacterium]
MELLKFISLRWWLCLTLATGCKTTSPSTTSQDINAYQEDISSYRTALVDSLQMALDTLRVQVVTADNADVMGDPIPATQDNTEGVNALMDSIASFNARIPYVEGFTILVYSGTNRDRSALVQREVQGLGHTPRFEYARPNFKVKVGRFTDQLEARRTHLFLKQHFRSAIIVPERIILK